MRVLETRPDGTKLVEFKETFTKAEEDGLFTKRTRTRTCVTTADFRVVEELSRTGYDDK